MFRTKEEIRRATRATIWARGYAEGRAEARKEFLNRLTEAVRRFGILDETTGVMMLPLTPEVEDFLHSDTQRGQPLPSPPSASSRRFAGFTAAGRWIPRFARWR